jgi:hypothetical protein
MSVRDDWVIEGFLKETADSICACVTNEFPNLSVKILRAAYGYFHCSFFDEGKQEHAFNVQIFRDKVTCYPKAKGSAGEYAIAVLEDPDACEMICNIVLDNYLAMI